MKQGECRRDATGYLCPDQGPRAPTEANVAGMSRDPAVLYATLRAQVNAGPPAGTSIPVTPVENAINSLLDLINDSITVPADLRAALLRTLGYLPGISLSWASRTTDGRAAVAIGWVLDGGRYRNELLLDSATGRTVEWRNVALKPFDGYHAGQSFSSWQQTEAVVHALGEEPGR